MRKFVFLAVLGLLAWLNTGVGFAADAEATVDPKFESVMATLKTCETCHGPGGNSVIPLNPILAGQHLNYIYIQLKDFKSGSRKNDIMNAMAAAMEKKDMLLISEYFSKKGWPLMVAGAESVKSDKMAPKEKPVTGSTTNDTKAGESDSEAIVLDEKTIALANSVIVGGQCVQCHLGGFEGNSGVPRSDGQHFEYLKKTLLDLKSRARNNAPDKATLMSDFTEEQIIAIARYISSLPISQKPK